MKKRRTFLALVITLCVLVGAYAAIMLYNKYSTVEPEPETPDMVIYTCASISDIAYTYQDEPLHFVWSDADSQWSYAEDTTFPLKQSKMTAMVRDLKSFTVLRLVQQGTDNLQSFGLDQPVFSFTAITGTGETVSFQIGAQNTTTGHYYLHMDGKDAIYLLDKADAAHFLLKLNDLATLDTLPKADQKAVHELRFQGTEGVPLDFVYLENGSERYYTDRQNWFLKAEDGTLTPVDDFQVDTMLTEILAIKYQSCLTYRASEPERMLLGLADPLYSVSVDYTATIEEEAKEGETPKTHTEEASFTLSLGALYEDSLLCAQLEGSEMVGLVDLQSIMNTLQTKSADLYPRDVCQLRLDEISSMTAVWNDKTYQIDISRQEETAADGKTTTTATYTVNGTPVDAAAMETFFNSISGLQAESRTDSDPGKAAEFSITFVRDRSTFGKLTMELIPYDTNFDLVRFAGDNSLLVNRRSVQTLTGLLENL